MKTSSIRLACVLALTLAAGQAGCMGHGKETSKAASAAKLKMNAMKAGTEWQMARQAFLAGDLKKAERHAQKSIELNENVAKSHVMMGRIKLEQGDLDAASKSLAKAEALDPTSVDAQYYTGIMYERYARKDQALERYLKAAELEPENAQYAIAAAEMMIDLNRRAEAKEFLTTRRSAFEQNAGVRQTLGHIALMDKEPQVAVELFTEARLLAPDDSGILEDLARAHFECGQYADADRYLQRALKSDEAKGRRDLLLLRATCLTKIQRHVESRDILLNILRDPEAANDAEVWVQLGEVALAMNDSVRVRQAAARVIAVAPNRPEGYLLRALSLRQSGNLAQAESAAQKAVEVTPTADGYLLLGTIQKELGKASLAQQSFASAQKLDATASPEKVKPVQTPAVANVPEADSNE